MILKRQKIYSDSAILEILSNFGRILGLKYLAKIGKQFWQKLKDLAKRFKHPVTGKPTKGYDIKHKETTKNFSDVSLNADFSEYSKKIPFYELLTNLAAVEKKILKMQNTSEDEIDFIYKYFPSFQGLCDPETINLYRKNYIKSENKDFAEILFAFGGELVYVWDFDNNSWHVFDTTYSPSKGWELTSKNIFESLRQTFDENENELLKNRLKTVEDKYPEQHKVLKKYCKDMLNLVEAASISAKHGCPLKVVLKQTTKN